MEEFNSKLFYLNLLRATGVLAQNVGVRGEGVAPGVSVPAPVAPSPLSQPAGTATRPG